LAYDYDGNLTQDGTYNYTWDGENRLIAVAPRSPGNGDKKATFVYDYLNRRVEKDVYVYAGGWPTTPNERRRFMWSGWLMVLELADQGGTGVPPVARKYTWGLDLAGLNGSVNSLQSAGGISGLLAVHDATVGGGVDYVYCYDGNGNVASLVNLGADYSYQATVAHYEYDPYGNVTASSGDYAATNPFRFSTKYLDAETGLYYFGYRYYMPRLGRWLSRDPVGESFGMNLYEYVRSHPSLGVVDPLGQYGLEFCDKAACGKSGVNKGHASRTGAAKPSRTTPHNSGKGPGGKSKKGCCDDWPCPPGTHPIEIEVIPVSPEGRVGPSYPKCLCDLDEGYECPGGYAFDYNTGNCVSEDTFPPCQPGRTDLGVVWIGSGLSRRCIPPAPQPPAPSPPPAPPPPIPARCWFSCAACGICLGSAPLSLPAGVACLAACSDCLSCMGI
jgi:RHS repeat-associated protein